MGLWAWVALAAALHQTRADDSWFPACLCRFESLTFNRSVLAEEGPLFVVDLCESKKNVRMWYETLSKAERKCGDQLFDVKENNITEEGCLGMVDTFPLTVEPLMDKLCVIGNSTGVSSSSERGIFDVHWELKHFMNCESKKVSLDHFMNTEDNLFKATWGQIGCFYPVYARMSESVEKKLAESSNIFSSLLKMPKINTLDQSSAFAPWLQRLLSLLKPDLLNITPDFFKEAKEFLKRQIDLISHSANNNMQLLLPFVYESMGVNLTTDQLDIWQKRMLNIKNLMLTIVNTEMYSFLDVSIANNDQQLDFVEWDFSKLFGDSCEKETELAPIMLNQTSYFINLYFRYLFSSKYYYKQAQDIFQRYSKIFDIGFLSRQLFQDITTVSADTTCVQLMVDEIDQPTCPMEDLIGEMLQMRLQCRVQLANNFVYRTSYLPITSYLAYTQRVNIDVCLLSLMIGNIKSICQDVHSSVIESLNDVRCVFSNSGDPTCLLKNFTDAICSISRGILWLKCRKKDTTFRKSWFNDLYEYKRGINNLTLKYRSFKIDPLMPLEVGTVALNIFFRSLTIAVYLYLPNLRNTPGKILLCFQMTGLIQLLFSEVLYRMCGVPDLSTTVYIDSALTLLSCIWLNVFCFEMFDCVRQLRLPDHTHHSLVSREVRKYAMCAVVPWALFSSALIALGEASEQFIFHSRILFLIAISLSVGFNLALLAVIGAYWVRNRRSMENLKIFSNNKFANKTQLVFLTIKTFLLTGLGVVIRLGFQQFEGVAQVVYYVHFATMVQGPLLFVMFVCNEIALPLLTDRIRKRLDHDAIGQEMCSSAERNLERRRQKMQAAVEADEL